MTTNRSGHIRLTSHPGAGTPSRFPIRWGAPTARERGPVIGTVTAGSDRNAVGAHGGAYALYRALAVSAGALNPIARPDFTNTAPVVDIGPHPQWSESGRIVSLDPWGHRVHADFRAEIAEGLDIRPTVAVTRARLTIAELDEAVARGRLKVDGDIIRKSGDVAVTKAAIDPVWHLPGIAERFGVAEDKLRRTLFEQTGGMYPELATPHDLLPRTRRVQRLRRVRLRHMHLPALSDPRDRGMRAPGADRRSRTDRLQSQGRPRAGRGDQVPRLQRAQAPGGGRPGEHIFRAHRMRRRRAGRALPAADARRAALARHHPYRPLRVHVQHEIRSDRRLRHRHRRTRADSRRPGAG